MKRLLATLLFLAGCATTSPDNGPPPVPPKGGPPEIALPPKADPEDRIDRWIRRFARADRLTVKEVYELRREIEVDIEFRQAVDAELDRRRVLQIYPYGPE